MGYEVGRYWDIESAHNAIELEVMLTCGLVQERAQKRSLGVAS
jgi:hypothetical protein